MIKKVLINDDHDAIIDNVSRILIQNGIQSIQTAQYCDEAYLKLKRAELDQLDFDLLITDLSFKRDHRNTKLDSGESLIAKLREEFPDLPIIVYSMKDQIQKVRQLIHTYYINAYVCKDRNGSKELDLAIKSVQNGELFLSPQVARALKPKTNLEIDDFDIKILQELAKGKSQEDISNDFKSIGISPCSLSTIEKRLNKLRIQFKANNAIHLVAITKDMGLI